MLSFYFIMENQNVILMPCATFVICLFFISLRHRFPHLAGGTERLSAIQTTHNKLTPRIGGAAIVISLAGYMVFLSTQMLSEGSQLLFAVSILFIIGLAEDLGQPITPNMRLLAACVSSVLVIALSGVWLPRFDIPIVDALMPYWFIGIPISLLLTTGIVHSFNLIDGMNGLAAGIAIITTLSLSQIAAYSDNVDMAYFAFYITIAIIGFLVLNFPFGLIFLGDAGAYTLGFLLGWISIIILHSNDAVTPWAIFLTMFWPLSDTFLAMYRRKQRNAPKMAPDRLHVHQLVMRTLEISWLGRNRRHIANPLVTIILLPLAAIPAFTGVLFWNQPQAAFLATLFYTLVFWGGYFLAFRIVAIKHRAKET